MLRYLLEKEFKQILRNPILPKLIFVLPVVMLLVLPWAANQEVKNIHLSVVDGDHSTYSQRMVQKVTSSGYFLLTDVSATHGAAMRSVEAGQSDLILEVPPGFERSLVREGAAAVMITANAVNGTKASLGAAYLSAIVGDFAGELRQELGQRGAAAAVPTITISGYNKFNPYLDYKVFMVPALMVMLLTLLTGFLPALNIVSEKEVGTIEQINVTPVGKLTFILAKLIPYWLIGFIVLTIGVGIAALVYGLLPAGSLFTIYLYTSVYILALSGLGLLVSSYSNTMQQAMFLIFFFVLVLILISGLFTPVSSMPAWARAIAMLNPLKYFMEVMRAVYLKGSSLPELLPQLLALCGFAVALNGWAVVSYKKSA